ncbi:MAG: transcriptional repressor [Oleispira sp.]|nr:transcriptional repressor [Oleispira sp.]
MKNVDHIIHHAEEYCRNHGIRLTIKRKHVLTRLIQAEKALSAYELMDACQENNGEVISAMSVYRILEFLENETLVHKLNLANKYVACAHINCNHTHGVSQFLICSNCSKVKEININPNTMADLQATVQERGFTLIRPQLEMNCLCNDCLVHAA